MVSITKLKDILTKTEEADGLPSETNSFWLRYQTIGGTKTFSNQIVLNNGSTTLKASGLYYIPFSYGGLITLSGSFTSLLTCAVA